MKRWLLIFRLFLLRSGIKRAKYLKEHKIFYSMGENCYYHPSIITTEPYLVKFGNNVSVASGVKFITHDIMGYMIDKSEQHRSTLPLGLLMGKIVVGNNVAIGQDAHILYNTTIGDNVIIAAGSVVCKDIPSNSVAAGIPCKVIGTYDDFVKKRNAYAGPRSKDNVEEIISYFWGGQNENNCNCTNEIK